MYSAGTSFSFLLFFQCSPQSALVRSFRAWWVCTTGVSETLKKLLTLHVDVAQCCCSWGNRVTKYWIQSETATVRTPLSHFLACYCSSWLMLVWPRPNCLLYQHKLYLPRWALHLLISAYHTSSKCCTLISATKTIMNEHRKSALTSKHHKKIK